MTTAEGVDVCVEFDNGREVVTLEVVGVVKFDTGVVKFAPGVVIFVVGVVTFTLGVVTPGVVVLVG